MVSVMVRYRCGVVKAIVDIGISGTYPLAPENEIAILAGPLVLETHGQLVNVHASQADYWMVACDAQLLFVFVM